MFDKEKRREVMSKIRSRGSKLDRAMQKIPEASNMEYEMYPDLFGKPDFLVKPLVAVFCDSAFWHGRHWPKLRKKLELSPDPEYWVSHIARNRERDREVTQELQQQGYLVIRFWDHGVFRRPEGCLEDTKRAPPLWS